MDDRKMDEPKMDKTSKRFLKEILLPRLFVWGLIAIALLLFFLAGGCSTRGNVGIFNEEKAILEQRYSLSYGNLYAGLFTFYTLAGPIHFHGYNLYKPDASGPFELCEKSKPKILKIPEECGKTPKIEEMMKKSSYIS